MNTQEYRKIFDFFVVEIADLVLRVCNVDLAVFEQYDSSFRSKKTSGVALDLKKAYGKCSAK